MPPIDDKANTIKAAQLAFRDTCERQGITERTPVRPTLRGLPRTLRSDRETGATQTLPDEVDFEPDEVLTRRVMSLPAIHVAPGDEGAEEQGEFKILSLLGEGGMGLVHLALQRALGREVALKVIQPELVSKASVEALLLEARLCGRLEHPNIVPVHALARDHANQPQLVMKRVEGTSWFDLANDRDHAGWRERRGERLERHVEILLQVCNAVEFAHSRGVVHRDIKLENVMVGDFGEVYLLDWGIALQLGEPGEAGWIVGTPSYMAPEMVAADPALVTPRTDVYLLGATLHEVLTGRERHDGHDIYSVFGAATESAAAEYPAEIPPELASIVNRACSRDPEDRYGSVVELRQALTDFLEHRGSVRIADAAQQVLTELRTRIEARLGESSAAAETVDREATLQIHQLFSECRFGFREALRSWDENLSAREGLQSCVELMARHELHARNYDAARTLVAELLDPLPELESRLEVLGEELRNQEDARAELERLRSEQRFQGQDWRRSVTAVIVGVTWAILIGSISMAMRAGILVVTPVLNLAFVSCMVLETVVVAWIVRGFLFENRILRQFFILICCVIGVGVLNRIVALLYDVTFHQILMCDLLLVLAGLAFIAVTIVPTFWWAAAGTVLAVIIAALFPDLVLEVFTAVILMGHLFGGWALRPMAPAPDAD